MTLALTLPRPDTKLRFALTRGELGKWLDTLPVGNAPEAARCLVQQLSAINRTSLGAPYRVELAELFCSKLEAILPALEAELAQATLPLTGKRRAIATVADEALAELTYAYMSALASLSASLIPFGVRRRLQRPVLQAMRALARRLTVGYRVYAPRPATAWQDLHLLHRLASKHGIAETPIAGSAETPSSVYRNALLLAFAQPHKLMHGEVDRILAYLAAFGDRSILVYRFPKVLTIRLMPDRISSTGKPPGRDSSREHLARFVA